MWGTGQSKGGQSRNLQAPGFYVAWYSDIREQEKKLTLVIRAQIRDSVLVSIPSLNGHVSPCKSYCRIRQSANTQMYNNK